MSSSRLPRVTLALGLLLLVAGSGSVGCEDGDGGSGTGASGAGASGAGGSGSGASGTGASAGSGTGGSGTGGSVEFHGPIGPWTTTTNLPSATWRGGAAGIQGHMYVVRNSPESGTVFFAQQQADGNLAAWDQTTATFPAEASSTYGFGGFVVTASADTLYIVARNNGGVRPDGVLYGKPSADGDILELKTFPFPDFGPGLELATGATFGNGALYALSRYADLFYGAVGGDGSVTEWKSIPALDPGDYIGMQVVNGYLYVIGQYPNRVWYSKLAADGTPSALVDTTPIPSGCDANSASTLYTASANGFLYGGSWDALCFADLHADGVVGSWTNTGFPPQTLITAQFALFDGFAYMLGGEHAQAGVSTSYVAPLE